MTNEPTAAVWHRYWQDQFLLWAALALEAMGLAWHGLLFPNTAHLSMNPLVFGSGLVLFVVANARRKQGGGQKVNEYKSLPYWMTAGLMSGAAIYVVRISAFDFSLFAVVGAVALGVAMGGFAWSTYHLAYVRPPEEVHPAPELSAPENEEQSTA